MENGRKKTYTFEDIEDIQLQLEVVAVDIVCGDRFEITTVEYNDDRFNIIQNGNSLSINADIRSRFGFLSRENRISTISIMLEKSQLYSFIDCSLKVGEIRIEELNCERFKLNTDVSEGVVKNLVAEEVSINNTVGDMLMYATVNKRLSVSNATGDIEINLNGKEDDYSIDYENSIGSLRIGNHIHTSGLSNCGQSQRNPDMFIDVENRIGDVTIHFR